MALVPIVPNGSGEGNTKPEPKKQIAPAKRWCFTFNNYTNENIKQINDSANSSNYLIFAEEMGKNGTKHLQGYIEFKKKCRPKNILSDKIHWEKAKGNRESNIQYIQKEFGNCYINGKKIRKMELLQDNELQKWELDIIKIIENGLEKEDRKMYWFWEEEGNFGKSTFTKYLCVKYNALIAMGKINDIACMINTRHQKTGLWPDIIIIDLPRSFNDEYLNYPGLESIKNGCFFSAKYESDMILMPKPIMIFFSNQLPDESKISKDRWVIKKLKH